MKIVLDSNVLLVAVGKRSSYKPIWDVFVDGKYKLILSDEIIYEYREILEEHSAPRAADIIEEIFIESADIIIQHIYYKWNAVKQDPDDNKFFDVAVAANADYLVTNDNHFNQARHLAFPAVKIISGGDFLRIIQSLS
jgi:putative PIN family toxin of toxin-antitoxin system